ncbi:MAG: hypothetical protein VB080_08255 [Propionicimonas sp.]|uniref:hypothetical protein n=1 Tax=Propionicimonas sp. TaxID=1955623 RepID=UPI002B1F2206|nr:hypothetical protein [Propionicimonas sp.]MEA4944417.1 hypothetical protein [Propionicimonas sp.]MEA5052343.1 hypothetical protein [Propionicimonas sp.]MEA5117934.1 hypothetical protein [Propionicimonas sp.]
MATTTHLMKPRPPLRAFGIAAVLAVVGIGFFALELAVHWHWALQVVGVVFLVLGLLLVVLALIVSRQQYATVELDNDGFRVVSPSSTRSGEWDDIVKVTRAAGRITLFRRDGSQIALVVPRGGSGDLNALGRDIADRLNAHRGYGSVPPGPADPAE